MTDDLAATESDGWAAIGDLERTLATRPGDVEVRRRLAAALHDEAILARSVTRDQTLEITSARQLRICEYAARRILSLEIDDEELNSSAMAMLNEIRAGRRWIWVNRASAITLSVLAMAVGIVAAVIGGLAENIALAAVGAVISSMMLGAIVLRFRRENWRIRADRVAPMIWKPGV